MLKYLIILFVLFFTTVSAYCSARTSLRQQKSSIEEQLKTATGSTRVELLLNLSLLYQDSVNIAIAHTHQAIAEAIKIKDQQWIAKGYTNLATCFLKNGSQIDSAATYLAEAGKAYSKTGKKRFDADFYLTQARYLFATNQTDAAGLSCRKALETAQADKNGLVLADSYVLLARIAKKNSDLKQFVEYLRLAEKEFLLCSDKESSGRSLISVGLLYTDAGMSDMSQKVLVEATRLCERHSDSLYLGYLYCNISGIYGNSSHQEMSLVTLRKAVTIFSRLKNNKGLGYAQNMLGLYYVDQKKYKEALNWFAKTIATDTLAAEWQGACFAACNMADVFMAIKKYDPIMLSFAKAERYMQKAGDPLSAIVFYNTKARFEVLDKNYTEAFADFNTSLGLARETGNNIFYLDNLKSLADLYNLSGDQGQALLYFRKYVDAGDSVRSAQAPLQQQELISQLNSGQLIDMAVKEKEKSVNGYMNYLPLTFSVFGILLMLTLSVKVFGRKAGSAVQNPGVKFNSISESSGNSSEKSPKFLVNEQLQLNIWVRLQQKMQNEKYYLHPALSLHDLAEVLGTNTSYLSKVINDRTGQNFNSFVNQYRIEEACLLLTNPKQQFLSIEGIALSVGFNSKSAFNAAFKKIKGFTPSEFVEQQKILVS